MTITLTQAIRESGAVVESGTTITRASDVEEHLVTRGIANRVILSPGILPAMSNVYADVANALTPTGGYGNIFDIFTPGVLAEWNTDYGSGITISLDANVLFNGNPTIRVDIAAGTSGFKTLVGVTGATAKIPYGWDGKRIAVAMKTTNKDLFTAMSGLVGDATYANNWAATIPVTTSYLAANYLRNNEWLFFRNIAAATVTGSPVAAQRMRAKLAATITASASNESLWIGFFGILPQRKKPTIICCTDDGNDQHYTFLAPLLRFYDIPMSFAINCGRIGTSTYMSQAQVMELQNDKSQLFDFINHGYTPKEYGTYGSIETFNDFEKNRKVMASWGLPDLGSRIVSYPSGEFDDDLVKLLQSGGYYGARAVNYAETHTYDQLWPLGDKGAFMHAPCSAATTGVSVDQMLAAVATNTAAKGCSQLMFHRFGDTDAAERWTYDKAYRIFAELAALRNAGTIELVTYSRHMAGIYGLQTIKR